MQDKDIIELFWQRDEAAITATDRKYGKYCHRIAMNVLENKEDADECVSDTWLKTWNAIPENRPYHFQGFLAKITRHIAIDRWKHQTAAKRGKGTAYFCLAVFLSGICPEYRKTPACKSKLCICCFVTYKKQIKAVFV